MSNNYIVRAGDDDRPELRYYITVAGCGLRAQVAAA
jgi:hypothetical protein